MKPSSPSKLFSLAYPAIVLFVVLTGPVAGLMLDPSPAVPFVSDTTRGTRVQRQVAQSPHPGETPGSSLNPPRRD